MERGYLALILHAHLPFVRHPESEEFLEEDWLYEAITETYIPLIWMLEGLLRDGVPFQLTMSLTPPLVAMLQDPLLQSRYLQRLNRLIELAGKEVERTLYELAFHRLAKMYLERFLQAKETFEAYGRDLTNAFRRFQEEGCLEIMASAATHGYLPALSVQEAAVRAQIQIGVEEYERTFGRRPQGFWLPECGYFPGLDEVLKSYSLRYTILESHGLLHGVPRPKYGVYTPIYSPSGIAAFGRDPESSKQVWSSIEGYPGDYDYREFYRDIGYDLDYDYIRPYLHSGIRTNTGIKYHRITGKTEEKEPYDPERALEKAAVHAGHFLFSRVQQIERLSSWMGRYPIIVAPYDAELFGHWWFEGPEWLNFLIRKIAEQGTLRLITPSVYLERYPTNQLVIPSASSWGYGGYHATWINGANDWIYPHLHMAASRMQDLARAFPDAHGLKRRALNQAVRELLLAQSSDWAFIMKTGTMAAYAVKRTKEHLLRFDRLRRELLQNRVDEAFLHRLEEQDNLFPSLDYRVFRSR